MPIDIEIRELAKRGILAAYIRYGIVAALVVIGIPESLLIGAAAELRVALALAFSVLAYNTLSLLYLKNIEKDGKTVLAALLPVLADTFVFTWLIHLSSGIVSPYAFFYLFPVVTAGMVFQRRRWAVYGTAAAINLFYDALLFLQYSGALPLPGGYPWLPQLYASLPRVATFGIMVPLAVWVLTVFVVQAGLLIQRRRSETEAELGAEISGLRAQLEKKLEETNAELFRKNRQLETALAELKGAEEERKEAEQRFKIIFDNATDGMLLADLEEKRFFLGNAAICRMLGYGPEEIKGMGVMDIHPKKDLPYVIEQFQKQARKEITLAENLPVQRKDGSVFYADINSSPVELSGKQYLLGMFRDITERRRAEEELARSEEKFRMTFDNLAEGIVSLDTSGKVTDVNPAILSIVGYGRDELVGKSIAQVIPGLKMDVGALLAAFKDIISGKPIGERDWGLTNKKGEKVMLRARYSPLKKEGRLIGILSVVEDVTARRRAEEALRASEETYRALFEYAPDGILAMDRMGFIRSCNKTFTEITGFSGEDVVGKHFSKVAVLPIKDIPRFVNVYKTVMQGRMVEPFEYEFVTKDGRRRTGLMHVSATMKDGKVHEIQARGTDITDRREARAEKEKLTKFMTGREDRVIELKQEVNRLLKELGREPKYKG